MIHFEILNVFGSRKLNLLPTPKDTEGHVSEDGYVAANGYAAANGHVAASGYAAANGYIAYKPTDLQTYKPISVKI